MAGRRVGRRHRRMVCVAVHRCDCSPQALHRESGGGRGFRDRGGHCRVDGPAATSRRGGAAGDLRRVEVGVNTTRWFPSVKTSSGYPAVPRRGIAKDRGGRVVRVGGRTTFGPFAPDVPMVYGAADADGSVVFFPKDYDRYRRLVDDYGSLALDFNALRRCWTATSSPLPSSTCSMCVPSSPTPVSACARPTRCSTPARLSCTPARLSGRPWSYPSPGRSLARGRRWPSGDGTRRRLGSRPWTVGRCRCFGPTASFGALWSRRPAPRHVLLPEPLRKHQGRWVAAISLVVLTGLAIAGRRRDRGSLPEPADSSSKARRSHAPARRPALVIV